MDYNKALKFTELAKSKGYSDNEISSELKSKGYDINKLQETYTKQYKPASQEGGFLHEIVKSIAHVPLKFASTGESLAQDAKSFYDTAKGGFKTMDFSAGDKIRREGVDYGYLGKVSPIGGNFQETGDIGAMAKDVFGTALEGATWIPTGGTAGAGLVGLEAVGKLGAKQAFKNIGKLALTGAKQGAISGSLYGAGESMQNNESIVDTLLNTVKFGAIGGVTGGILNPAVTAGSNVFSDTISNVSEKGIKQGIIDSIGNVIDNTLPTKTTSIAQDVIDNNLSTDFKKGMKSYDSLLQESQKTIKPLQGASSDIQDAYMKEISSIDNPFTEIIEGGEKKLSLKPALEKVATDIKSLAEKGTTIAKEYKGASIAPEVVDEINNLAAKKMSSGVIGKTKEFLKALKKEIDNFYLNDNLSLDELLNIKRNIDISNILESSTEASAQKEARAVIKEALSNKIHEKLPEIANLDSQISQKMKFMSLFANDKSIFKGGTSTLQDIGGIAASILAAPQGIIVSFTLRNAVKQILSKIAPGVTEFISSTTKAKPEINNLISILKRNGVDENLASKFLRESSEYRKPTASTSQKVIEQLYTFIEQGIKNTEEQAVKKLTEAKSLIKIIKGLGTDIETIKEVVNEAGKDITDTQAKALTAMNKNNTSKSISSYLELLNSLPQKKNYEEAQQIKKGLLSNDFKGMFKNQRGFIENSKSADNLSTKILEDLKGKTTVSKQYILDATNRGELKQVERDITRQVLEDMTKNKTSLNVGMNIGDGKIKLTEKQIVDEIKKLDIEIKSSEIKQSGTEPTFIPTLSRPLTKKELYNLSKNLQQDAIAQASPDASLLEGPKAADWGGKFNQEYYINPTDTINVKEFADKVKSELLPLDRGGLGYNKYENITLPGEIRGDVKNYREHIYNSPIQTSAGDVHFSGTKNNAKNYFGHTRIEDMADNKTRRVIEVQSDLYQKGNLERELSTRDIIDRRKYAEQYPDSPATPGHLKLAASDEKNILKEKGKLQQYNDPTAHFRMVREEIKKASLDGKTKLQFPTGETAMKIEGLGENSRWIDDFEGDVTFENADRLLKVGNTLKQGTVIGDDWIITDVLGDGKFKAVTKGRIENMVEDAGFAYDSMPEKYWLDEIADKRSDLYKNAVNDMEQFDISGKVDTNNPIYKFYEKDMGKYLKSKYNAVPITDNNGVTWYQVDIKPEYKEQPVLAFGKTKVGLLPKLAAGQTALLGGIYGASKLKNNQNNKKEETPSKKGLLINP